MHSELRSGPYVCLAELERQEQERSVVKGREPEPEPQVERDGSPVYPPNGFQTDAGMRPSSFNSSHTKLASSSSPRPIKDFSRILYPESISSPSAELNAGIKNGKFRYDRNFLMQFQAVCKDKPLTLAPLHDIGLGFLDPSSLAATTPSVTTARGGDRRQPPALPAPVPPQATSIPPVFGVTSVGGEVNNNPPKQPPPKQPPPKQPRLKQPSVPSIFGVVQLVELIRSASPELVDSAVESLLGKLNKDNVDVVSGDIARWANKSEEEKDGRTLDQVICLVIKNAIDDPTQSDTYAQLCIKMRAHISGKVRDVDDATTGAQGKITGGTLFHARLLAKCQEHFDKDWDVMEVVMTGISFYETPVHATDKKGEDGVDETEPASTVSKSDEPQAAKQARRLGLIKFIVELFRVQMVGKRIIHKFARRLIDASNPGDQRIEGLCELLKQVYFTLDGLKDHTKMDGYFRHMDELGKSPGISPHIRSMLQQNNSRLRCTFVSFYPI